jgi:hypothetical protein
MMAVFRFRFASFRFEAKRMAVFRFRFASFRFEEKMMAVFRFFFVLFSFRSIFVPLQISTFRIDAKQAKKAFFFASKRKKFRFRFPSFLFEAKITAHPTTNHIKHIRHRLGGTFIVGHILNMCTVTAIIS